MSRVDDHDSLTLIDTEEGHVLTENFVKIFYVTSLSVSLHNVLDFYIYIYINIKVFYVMSVTQNRNSYTLRGHPLDSLEETNILA
jgi:hypothetical protein